MIVEQDPFGADPTRERIERIERLEEASATRGGDPHLLHEIGRLWQEGGSPRRAAYAWERAHRADPNHLPTLRAARALFAQAGQWEMVARLLLAEENATPCPQAKHRLLLERARVLEGRLGRRADARRLLERALSTHPGDAALLSDLERILTLDPDPLALASVQERLADAIDDPPLQARLLCGAASIVEGHLRDPDRAADLYQRAHRLAPDEPIAASELQRHLERQGRYEEWEQMLGALAENAAAHCGDPTPILYRLARLQLRLDREDAALSTLLTARERNPHDRLILLELSRIHHVRKDWEALAEILWQRVHIAADDQEKIALLLDLGALYEERLERPEDAIECHRAVVAMAPTHSLALSALGKLLHQIGDWKGLLTTFEAEALAVSDPGQRAARLFKAAQLLEEKLNAPEEAIARYHQILDRLPGYLPAREALSRIYERSGRFAEWVRLLEDEVLGADREGAIALLIRIAEIQDEKIGDRQRAVDAYRRVLSLAPSYVPALKALGRIFRQKGQWADLVSMHLKEAEASADPLVAAAQLFRVGELYEQKLFDEDRAVTAYQEVLQRHPGHLPALRQLSQIYRQRAEWDSVVEILRREVQVRMDPAEKAAVLCEIAEIRHERQHDPARAIAAWSEVLLHVPTHRVALDSLERLLLGQGRFLELIRVYERAADAGPTDGTRAQLFLKAARIHVDFLGESEVALALVEEALRLAPGDLLAWKLRERLHGEPLAARERVAAQTSDPRLAAALSTGEGRRQLLLAIDANPHDPLAWERLERQLEQQGDHAGLCRILERHLEVESDPATRLVLLHRLGATRLAAFGDWEGALECWDDALTLAPDYLPVVEARARLLEGGSPAVRNVTRPEPRRPGAAPPGDPPGLPPLWRRPSPRG